MNSRILMAIESICNDISTDINPEKNRERADTIVLLAAASMFIPAECECEHEDTIVSGNGSIKKQPINRAAR